MAPAEQLTEEQKVFLWYARHVRNDQRQHDALRREYPQWYADYFFNNMSQDWMHVYEELPPQPRLR